MLPWCRKQPLVVLLEYWRLTNIFASADNSLGWEFCLTAVLTLSHWAHPSFPSWVFQSECSTNDDIFHCICRRRDAQPLQGLPSFWGQASQGVGVLVPVCTVCFLLRLKCLCLKRKAKDRAVIGSSGREHCWGSEGRLYPWGVVAGRTGRPSSCSDNLVRSVIWEYFENWQEAMEKIKAKALKQTTILCLSYVYYIGILYI